MTDFNLENNRSLHLDNIKRTHDKIKMFFDKASYTFIDTEKEYIFTSKDSAIQVCIQKSSSRVDVYGGKIIIINGDETLENSNHDRNISEIVGNLVIAEKSIGGDDGAEAEIQNKYDRILYSMISTYSELRSSLNNYTFQVLSAEQDS